MLLYEKLTDVGVIFALIIIKLNNRTILNKYSEKS